MTVFCTVTPSKRASTVICVGGRAKVLHRHRDRHVSRVGFRERQSRDDVRVEQSHGAGGAQLHRLPQAAVAIADARNPVPAFARDERGAIDGEVAAVLAGPRGNGFLVRNAWVRSRSDAHGDDVRLTGLQLSGDIEHAADEGASDVAERFAVRPYLSAVVDAFEIQRELAAGELGGQRELRAIPVVLPRQSLRNGHVVEAVVRIRIHATIDQCRQHGAWHRGDVPGVITKARARDLCTIGRNLRTFREPPRCERPHVEIRFAFERRAGDGRRGDRLAEGSFASRQRPRILRLLQAAPRFHLPRPACAHGVKHHEVEVRTAPRPACAPHPRSEQCRGSGNSRVSRRSDPWQWDRPNADARVMSAEACGDSSCCAPISRPFR